MITVVDYGAGNLTSVGLALDEVGLKWRLSSDPAQVMDAERLIFPGVGAAAAAMQTLQERQLGAALRSHVASGRPFLGICLGTQIIFEHSEEDGGTPCLGILPGRVRHLVFPEGVQATCPHMGWNQVLHDGRHPLFDGIPSGTNFYFVHSYHPVPGPGLELAYTDYAQVRFASAVSRGNLAATQFHPEKSGRHGLRLLANFARWEPR